MSTTYRSANNKYLMRCWIFVNLVWGPEGLVSDNDGKTSLLVSANDSKRLTVRHTVTSLRSAPQVYEYMILYLFYLPCIQGPCPLSYGVHPCYTTLSNSVKSKAYSFYQFHFYHCLQSLVICRNVVALMFYQSFRGFSGLCEMHVSPSLWPRLTILSTYSHHYSVHLINASIN